MKLVIKRDDKISRRRAGISKLDGELLSKFEMKEDNRHGLDFVQWKTITERKVKRIQLKILFRTELKLFLC